MDIYNYLKRDHRKVSALMEEVLSARSPARRKEILETIEMELLLHAETEQATFYAALEGKEKVEENIDEAKEEHKEIKNFLSKLSRMSPDSERWMEQFGEFKHAVEHHVKEEEELIFKKARQILSDDKAKQLAREMDEMKEEAMAEVA